MRQLNLSKASWCDIIETESAKYQISTNVHNAVEIYHNTQRKNKYLLSR